MALISPYKLLFSVVVKRELSKIESMSAVTGADP